MFTSKPKFGIPEHYLPPEVLFLQEQDEALEEDDDVQEKDPVQEGQEQDSSQDGPLEGDGTQGNGPAQKKQEQDSPRDQENASISGLACDVWAMGCTIYEIRKQSPLFYLPMDRDDLLSNMVRVLGKLPDNLWGQWKSREEFYDEDGRWKQDDGYLFTMESYLATTLEIPARRGDPARTLLFPEAEQKLMADLMYRILKYEPEERASAEEVLAHDWFKFEG
jgi:serine/threonine protein kinase